MKVRGIAALLSVFFLLSVCSDSDGQPLPENAKTADSNAKSMTEKSKGVLPDTSGDYVQFTVTGYSGGTYRLEGNKANKCAGIVTLKGSARMLSLNLYDEASRTEVGLVGLLDLAVLSEQVVPVTPLTMNAVKFNTPPKKMTIVDDWQDHFMSMSHPLFYGNPDTMESAASRWFISSEKLPKRRLRIRGNVTFQAANNPLVQSGNHDATLVRSVLEEAGKHPGRRPPYNAQLAGTSEITVRGDFDITVVDTSEALEYLENRLKKQ
ncbi:MAG: hypothetical protein LBP99_01045 [Azoarcus sp.]|nr:hypothetical protein [Azoarcus sp.]